MFSVTVDPDSISFDNTDSFIIQDSTTGFDMFSTKPDSVMSLDGDIKNLRANEVYLYNVSQHLSIMRVGMVYMSETTTPPGWKKMSMYICIYRLIGVFIHVYCALAFNVYLSLIKNIIHHCIPEKNDGIPMYRYVVLARNSSYFVKKNNSK